MKSFGSDNHSGIHPDIMQAIESANDGHTPAYGDDPWTDKAVSRFRELFAKEDLGVYMTLNGTGANILALGGAAGGFSAIVCADSAHINTDECGAPEKNLGAKLIDIPGTDGKISPESIRSVLHGFGCEHHVQPAAISISQATEMGTLYSAAEIRALAELAHEHGMFLHVDGSRIANAVAATGVSPREMITETGVDLLSFGGTQNGMMIGEAVLVFDPALERNLKYRRKQSLQLYSKMRFVSAQFSAYLSDSLWLRTASRSNRMASLLCGEIAAIPGVEITRPCQSNAVFARLPAPVTAELQSDFHFHVWDGHTGEVRLMCSFDTAREDIEDFASALGNAMERFMKKTCV